MPKRQPSPSVLWETFTTIILGFLLIAASAAAAAPLAYSTFDLPESVSTFARGINNMGEIVGSYYTMTSIKGFLRDGRTFTTISPPTTRGAPSAEALGLNDVGQIVGIYGACDTCTTRGFLFSKGAFRDVIDPAQGSGGVTFATGTNNAGTVVGFYQGPSTHGVHGFVLGTDGKYAPLDFPGATDTLLWDINNAGQIVGRYTATGGVSHGFLFSDHGFTSVDFPGATFTQPMGINDRGNIVVIYSVGATPNHGFLLIPHGGEADDEMSDGFFTPVDFPGGSFTSPNGISNGGQIVGSYSDSAGRSHGFVAAVVEHGHVVSEPPSVALLLIGGIVLLSFPKLVLGCALARWPHRVLRGVVSRLVAERVAGRMDADHEAGEVEVGDLRAGLAADGTRPRQRVLHDAVLPGPPDQRTAARQDTRRHQLADRIQDVAVYNEALHIERVASHIMAGLNL